MPHRAFSVDPAAYPFQSRWYARGGSAMHSINEGEGIPEITS